MPLYFFLALGIILLLFGFLLWFPTYKAAEIMVKEVTGYANTRRKYRNRA